MPSVPVPVRVSARGLGCDVWRGSAAAPARFDRRSGADRSARWEASDCAHRDAHAVFRAGSEPCEMMRRLLLPELRAVARARRGGLGSHPGAAGS